ncbi:MAG TPA: hypothetical protein VGJ62_13810 [Gemmatimonadaceae bacterium]|jgi:hypothetical protein
MRRTLILAGLAMLLIIPATGALGQGKASKAQKIANAMTAAPRALSSKATIMDWPASEGAQMTTLRVGSNGWTCLPDFPNTKGNDPMCVDGEWMSFMKAMMSKSTPMISHAGIGYMTAPGGAYGSNKDPFATKATADNDWGYDPPHVMLLVTDQSALQGIPTARQNGAPWVMWAGTPYAHVMVPVSSAKK